ncbi:MAG TPA: glycoside hydrolase family 30 beta sandwich domain-containing protein [Polyangiaceae bacterium]
MLASGGAPSAGAGPATGGSDGVAGASAAGGDNTGGASTGGSAGQAPYVEPQVVTSATDAWWKTGALTEMTSATADVTVDDATPQQTWEGFGGAFNEAGWIYMASLSESDRATVMRLLFGLDGAHFTFGRIPIGASDYSFVDASKDKQAGRYTLNETADDYEMKNFSLERDKKNLIPFVQAALALRPDLRLWASPWTPPTWMKTPAKFDGGTMKSDAATLQAFALYLAKFVQEYGKLGMKVEAVAPQNEPNFEQGYPSAHWDTTTYVTFVRDYMGPTFMSMNVGANIVLGTMSNGDSGKDPSIVSAMMADSVAMGFVKAFGYQWGMQGKNSASKSLSFWQTEHKCGNYPWMGGKGPPAPNDLAYATESWGLIKQWITQDKVNSYSAWNMVLDPNGDGNDASRAWYQNALLVVNNGKLLITPTYYVFRHLSQFVDPGAKVVSTTGGDAIAFKNPDGTIVAVVYNSGAAKMFTVAVGGKKMQFDMPGSGWATVNYKP